MIAHVANNNFTSGELSEWMDARVDFEKYSKGLSICENAIVRPQGGVFGRGGSIKVTTTKYADKVTRLIPFRYSKTLAYMIELGHQYLRIYKNNAPLTYDTTITNVVSDSGVCKITTATPHGITAVNAITVTGVEGTTEANGDWAATDITVVDPNNFKIPAAFQNTYVSGGTCKVIVEEVTGYDEADLRDIQYAQVGNYLYLVHENYAVARLSRADINNEADWAFGTFDFTDGPYFDTNVSAITIDPSGSALGPISVTSSAALFQPGHENSLWRYSDTGTTWGYFKITQYISSTSVNAHVFLVLPGGANPPASTFWREGMWSDYQGYPSTVTIHDQRAVYDGGPGAPTTLVGSAPDSPEDMSPGANDDDAWVYTIGSGEQSAIRWLASLDALGIGTEAGELTATGNSDQAITPTSVRIKSRTTYGSNGVKPVRLGTGVAFTQRTGKRLRYLDYELTTDNYTAKDLGILADHILETYGVVEMSFQQERDSILWMIREDASLVGVTFMPEEEITAWHRHPTYGDGDFQSVACLPSSTFDRDDVWVICRRTINGVSKQYIEYLDPNNPGLDSAVIYDGALATTFDVPHLDGEVVAVVADDAALSPKLVVNGKVTIPNAASKVRIGLPFTGKVRTMRPEVPTPNGGTTQGLPRRWVSVIVRVKNVKNLLINEDRLTTRTQASSFDTTAPSLSGDFTVYGGSGFDTDGYITVIQDLPLPWAVTGIFGKIEYGVD